MFYRNLLLLILIGFPVLLHGQKTMDFDDITFPLSDTWSEVGDINVHPVSGKAEIINGQGILLNQPDKRNAGEDIYSTQEFGNFDLSFEYLMFPESNSGVYLHGNYEIQLRDSWGVAVAKDSDNGGVYHRWTEEGTGYDGWAPRQNASRAPGIWQDMKISFTAAEFDASGSKTSNARVSVTLNGVLIHDNVELTGPTRGARSEEVARGPLRIQGDHGAIAFREMKIVTFDNPKPTLENIRYTTYNGSYMDEPNYDTMSTETSGTIEMLTPQVSPSDNNFVIRYTGNLIANEPGVYTFTAGYAGGSGSLVINDQEVIPFTMWQGTGVVTLSEGDNTLEFSYAKVVDWVSAGLSLRVSGPGIREFELADVNIMANSVDPIYLDAPNVLRSFMDIPGEGRVVRAVSVGAENSINYTYDLDNGSLIHVWRGEFLDTTPMWHDRGDGSSRPRGTVTYLDGTAPPVQPLASSWKNDTTGLKYSTHGYRQGASDKMTFLYSLGGNQISDEILPLSSGHGVQRKLTAATNTNLYTRLGHGKKISRVAKGLFRVQGKGSYYVEIDPSVTAEIRLTPEGDMELLAPLGSNLTYSILF